MLNFWYAGCPPCQQEMPLLQRAADQHPNVTMLLINHRGGLVLRVISPLAATCVSRSCSTKTAGSPRLTA